MACIATALIVGGSIAGDRLAGLEIKSVPRADIAATIRPYLEAYKAERTAGETFSAWFGRARTNGEAPTPEQFHIELAERAGRLAGEKVTAAG